MSRHVVAAVAELPPGSRKLVTVKGRQIALFNVKGEFFALLNKCPHEGASLLHGQITSLVESDEPGEYRVSRQGELLRCPWHGWEFDIRTGQSWCDPKGTWVKQYACAIEPGAALAKGPFVAETFAVSVEQDYVVIEM
jgi:3-phenylpropionate/trans-cinnamate dioxygenase ferredoxin subunit